MKESHIQNSQELRIFNKEPLLKFLKVGIQKFPSKEFTHKSYYSLLTYELTP